MDYEEVNKKIENINENYLRKTLHDKDDINNVVKSLKSSLITQGENLDKFERKLNNRFSS